jgi:hypothetical protein
MKRFLLACLLALAALEMTRPEAAAGGFHIGFGFEFSIGCGGCCAPKCDSCAGALAMFPAYPDYGHDAYGYGGDHDYASYAAAPMSGSAPVGYAGASMPAPTVQPASYTGGYSSPSYWYGR